MLGVFFKGYITLTVFSLLTSCAVVEKDVQNVIPIDVTKRSSDEVIIRNNYSNNKPICKNNNLFCN